VLPHDADDVVTAVRYAKLHGLKVAAQSTGHNAGAHPSFDATMLIDLRELREITIDEANCRVRVGAGVRWQDVVPQLSAHGLAALHGSSPLVGIAGYSLGGGIGWLARKYGLQTNSVVALEIVTADGAHRRVNAANESELFWALRGGNGNFGVVTAIEFDVYRVPELYAGAMFFPVERAREVLDTWTRLTAGFPDEMMTWTSLLHFPDAPDVPEPMRGSAFTVFHGAYLGDADHGSILLGAIRDLGPLMDTFDMVPPAALADMAMDPTEPLPLRSTTALVDDLTPAGIDELLSTVEAAEAPLPLVQIRHMGGALRRRADGAGARATLPGEYCVFTLGVVPDASFVAPVQAALRSVDAVLDKYRVGKYPNFVEEPADAQQFFDDPTWSRLGQVKAAYDPANLFRGNHRIAPA
jgi:FAD/FMN-containing dehydrogenase